MNFIVFTFSKLTNSEQRIPTLNGFSIIFFFLFIYSCFRPFSYLTKWNISLQCVCITLTALRTINSTNNLQMLIDVSSYLINRYRGYITMNDET